jgi:ribosomal protein L39E
MTIHKTMECPVVAAGSGQDQIFLRRLQTGVSQNQRAWIRMRTTNRVVPFPEAFFRRRWEKNKFKPSWKKKSGCGY